MAIFGIDIGNNVDIKIFLGLTKTRLDNNIIFGGSVKQKTDNFYLIEMIPLLPPFYWIGFIGLFSTLYLAGVTKWLIPSLLISATSILWSKYFYFFMLWVGVKKNVHKGIIMLLSNEETIKRLDNHGTI